MSYIQKLIACRPAHKLIRYSGRTWSLGATRGYSARAPSKRSSRATWLLVGLTGAVGLQTGLVLKSHYDKEVKQWINGYIPGWAWYVDEYGSPFIEWAKQNLFQRGNEPLSSNKPISVTTPPPVEKTKEVKPSKSIEEPFVAKDDSSTPISQPSSTATEIKGTTTSDEDEQNTEVEVKEDSKPLDDKVTDKSIAKGSAEPDKSLENAMREESEGQAEIKTNLVNCLEEFTLACGDVVQFNVLLAESMENARYDLAKELLHKSHDDEAIKKSHDEAAASLKAKVEESYCSYCSAHQKLLAVISEAASIDLASQVSEANYRIFELTSFIQSSEDTVKRNKTINDAFDSFRDTMISTEIKLDQELAELNKSSFVDPSVVETVVLRLAETMVKVLNNKLQQLCINGGKNLEESLQHYREELIKTFEARMLMAMEESRADMQTRTEEKLEEARKKFEFELLEQLRRQALIHGENLARTLEEQAVVLEKKWQEEAKQKMAAQTEHYQLEMAAMYGKLAGIESTIDAVAKASHEARLQQGLHTACDNLFKALILANQCLEADKQYNFKKEIAGVMEVAGHDEMVSQLLQSIPEEAICKGIYSEEVLKERFYQVKRVCSRVSLVPLEGGGLGTYAISYVRSLLTFNTAPLNSDPSQLDTMGLLKVASAHLAAGDLEMTVRMMNHLQGEAGRVAKDWINDVRVYLQTKQAITTLADYTAAAGISLLK